MSRAIQPETGAPYPVKIDPSTQESVPTVSLREAVATANQKETIDRSDVIWFQNKVTAWISQQQ